MAGKRVCNYCQVEHDINKRLCVCVCFFFQIIRIIHFSSRRRDTPYSAISQRAKPSVELFSMSTTGQVPDERQSL